MSTDAATLAEYAAHVAEGRSVLVRPQAAYEGLDAVVTQVAALSSRPLTVTDLAGSTETRDALAGEGADPDALLAFHTSGSTGRPKCVVYRREVVTRHAAAIADVLGLGADDTVHVALPPARFAYGLSIVHSHAVAGVPVGFADAAWGLADVHAVLERTTAPIGLYVLPQHTPLLVAAGLDGSRVRRIAVAGGRLSTTAARSLAVRFPRAELVNMYGQAELGPRLTTWRGPLADFVEGTLGSPLPRVTLEVRDDDGAPTPAGRTGRIHARTPYGASWIVAPPYTQALPAPAPREAVDTGDRGVVTDTGDLRHEGRADHVVNVAGTKVDGGRLKTLVEDAFSPLVVRVGSRPARVGGDSVPVVEIVPGDVPVTGGAVRRVLHSEIGPLAGLCVIEIVDELHLTESGK